MLSSRTHLQGPETSTQNGRAAERYPAAFTPASSTEVNASRLPPPEDLAEMELAFREEPLSEQALIRKLRPWVVLVLLVGPSATLFSLMIGRVFPLGPTFLGLTLVGLLVAAALFVIPRRRNYRLILGAALLPPVYAVVAGIINAFIGNRLTVVLLLAAALAYLIFFAGRDLRPLQFYKEWIFTHPRLRPETRLQITTVPRVRPSIIVFVSLLFFLTVGYAYSPADVMIFLVWFPGFLACTSLVWRNRRRQLAETFVHYLSYTGRKAGAAGVWIPKSSLAARRAYLLSLLVLSSAAISIGTAFYAMPDYDFIERRAKEIAAAEKIELKAAKERATNEYWKAPEEVEASDIDYLRWIVRSKHTAPYQDIQERFKLSQANASADTNAEPKKDGEFFQNLLKDPLFSWLSFDLPGLSVQVWRKINIFLGHALIAIITATGWLILLFQFGSSRARAVRDAIDGQEQRDIVYRFKQLGYYIGRAFGINVKAPSPEFVPSQIDNDGRTEWQWCVDRIRTSRHEAIDPFGNTIREAEHLFLGVEPSLQVPVLLDRKIASEHCYIVGQTGSGKTTLGIMPILLQLIRGHASQGEFDFYDYFEFAVPEPLRERPDDKLHNSRDFLCAEQTVLWWWISTAEDNVELLRKKGPRETTLVDLGKSFGIARPIGAAFDWFRNRKPVPLEVGLCILRSFLDRERKQTNIPGQMFKVIVSDLVATAHGVFEQARRDGLGGDEFLLELVRLTQERLHEISEKLSQLSSGSTDAPEFSQGVQYVRGLDTPKPAVKLSPRVPIVIIDLKGDPALFNTVKCEAEDRNQEFLFFTPEKGKVTHRFNPFVGFKSEARTFIQLCQLFLDSLSLNHGEGYGRSYYSRRNRQALFLALTHPSKPQTFGELLDVMNEMFKSAEHRDAYEALTTIHALSQYDALITTTEQEETAPESVINMPRVIERSQIVYFWLPSAIESISTKEIGKLALFALLTAAIDRQLTNPQAETKQVYIVVDEFQRLAGENFKIVLEQARSFGLSAILANQTLADLKTRDSDLRSTVLTNTRMRLFFTMNDPLEMKMISTLSGEEIRLLRSWTATDDFRKYLRRDTQSETAIEGFKPRLTVNDIASISDHPLEMIAHITRGNGYTQFGGLPIRVRTAWPMPKEEYDKRSRTPWPTKEEFGLNEVIENLRSPKEIDQEALREVSEKQQQTLKNVLGEVEAST